MTVSAHTACRACGAESLQRYLDLGEQALANALVDPTNCGLPEFTAPLSVSWCPVCGLSQLDHVVDPAVLYADYKFRAGTSDLWRAHCVELANHGLTRTGAGRRFWIDVGSNDGALLHEVKDRGLKVLGVDPSDTGNGQVPMLQTFWSTEVAGKIARLHGQADVISATNVFGHVDDAGDFLNAAATALKPHGILIIECPHLIPFLDATAFDTVYHEHLSYWSLRPLEMLAERFGLKVVEVQMFQNLHGGTCRYTLVPNLDAKVKTSVTGLRILECALFQQDFAPYQEFAQRAAQRIDAFRELLTAEARSGRQIWGYGASAKGNVYLQATGLSEATIKRVVDDCAEKWGFLTPGTHIPITRADELSEPDVLALLSWNNGPALKQKARKAGFRGRFFVPHPEPHFDD